MSTTVAPPAGPSAPGLRFTRRFAPEHGSPFETVRWEQRTATITDESGAPVFEQQNIEAPASWSPLATKIAASKYFYGDPAKGSDPRQGGREHSIRQLLHRVTRTITDWGLADGLFADAASAEAFYADLTWLCLHQHGAFNSPVWFNVGLWHQYRAGEGRGAGNFFFDPARQEARRASTHYEYPQASACFIQSVEDSLEDIMRLAGSEAMLFKFGSGTGTDLTPLRSSREKLSGGGIPSGPLSFLKVYDQVANVVKSGGKTRRAAKMNTLKDWHPDIEEFIQAKAREERKAWALIEQGYDGSYNGEAYGSIMYQNENLSVRVSDEFMHAAVEGRPWHTRYVLDGTPCEEKDARTLLRQIAEGTWTCGDPGLQFDSTIHHWHTCQGTGRQNSTNPCSEYLFLDNTACNLASLNLLRFREEDGGFAVERFRHAIRLFITAQEILVDHASYPTREIAENSHRFRTLGLGYANLGALLMSYGLGYDSDEGRALAGALTALLTGEAYAHSARLARQLGPFPAYEDARCAGVPGPAAPENRTSMLRVIRQHQEAAAGLPVSAAFPALHEAARAVWEEALALGEAHGFRHAQVTVLAPTGTIGFLMDCDTTGIEPDIALVKYKLLAGGGLLKIVNGTVRPALRHLGYPEAETARILAHIDQFDTIEDVRDEATGQLLPSGLRPEHLPVFDCAFPPSRGERFLHYRGHLRMMAAAQPFLSGAISKTVNVPHHATVEEIMATYVEGWQLGLKAIAIYRDGSKRSAPLATAASAHSAAGLSSAASAAELETLRTARRDLETRLATLERECALLRAQAEEPTRRRMPETRVSLTHKFEIANHKGYLTVGMFENGEPGELFIQMNKEGSTIGGLMDSVATLTSIALQYGVPLESLVKKFAFQRFEPSGFTKNPDIRQATSITDYVFRWLGCQFIKGYKEATSPARGEGAQPELPLPELERIDQAALNRPVASLALPPEETLLRVLTHPSASTPGAPLPPAEPPSALTHAERVQRALGHMFMETPCSHCGSWKVIRAGACGVCTECGTSQGCS